MRFAKMLLGVYAYALKHFVQVSLQYRERSTFRQSMRSAKTLVGVYLTFLVCWTPYVIVLILDHSDTFSMETHLFVTLLAHSHSSTTFFIYLAFNRYSDAHH